MLNIWVFGACRACKRRLVCYNPVFIILCVAKSSTCNSLHLNCCKYWDGGFALTWTLGHTDHPCLHSLASWECFISFLFAVLIGIKFTSVKYWNKIVSDKQWYLAILQFNCSLETHIYLIVQLLILPNFKYCFVWLSEKTVKRKTKASWENWGEAERISRNGAKIQQCKRKRREGNR